MARFSICIATATLLFTLTSVAGPRVTGNGGNVTACQVSVNKTFELLDFFEMRVLMGRDMALDLSLSEDEMVEVLIARVSARVPKLAEDYRTWKVLFLSEAQFLSGVTLLPVTDSFPVALPANCAIEQVIVQKIPEYPGDRDLTG